MDISSAFAELATTRGRLPTEAVQWMLDHWDEAGPRLVAMLGRYAAADVKDISEDAQAGLFLAIHMLAEKRETAAFKPLCRLLRNAEATEWVLGDAVAATLTSLLISLHDGDLETLKALIEDPELDEYVRHAAMNAWAYFAFNGAISRDGAREYLQTLAQTMQPQEPHYAWVGIADAAILLGLDDLRPLVEDLIRRELIPPWEFDLDDFDRAMKAALADPKRKSAFDLDHVYPFAGTIEELSQWSWAPEEAEDDEREEEEADDVFAEPEEPYVNPLRHVGRNDPCPCGSGKKYKKCCLK